jgi:hypothetical protein
MRNILHRFGAAITLILCGAVFAAAGEPPPTDSAKPDAPVVLPGLPPLPAQTNANNDDSDASSGPAACGSGTDAWFTDTEYLYLKPYRRGLDFAIITPNAANDPEGSIQSDPWHTRSAFRVGVGYRTPCDGPEIGFFYTYLHDDQIGGLVRPAGGRLFATQTHPGTVEFVDRAAAEATLAYNVFDLEAGRPVHVAESLVVRPFGGLRFAEIGQNFDVVYDGGDANRDRVGSRLKFDGGGVRAGAQVDWILLDRWSLYGRAAGSLLIGDYHDRQTEFNNNGATPLTNVDESFRKVTPVVEMGFGIAYQGESVRLSVGYEIADWFNLVDTPIFVDDVHQGKYLRNLSDLGVDGLAARMEFVY